MSRHAYPALSFPLQALRQRDRDVVALRAELRALRDAAEALPVGQVRRAVADAARRAARKGEARSLGALSLALTGVAAVAAVGLRVLHLALAERGPYPAAK